jgi:hypothetical protein
MAKTRIFEIIEEKYHVFRIGIYVVIPKKKKSTLFSYTRYIRYKFEFQIKTL